MKDFIEMLKRYLEQNPPNYGDEESVLDILYWHYTEHGSSNSERIGNLFAELRRLVNFPPKEYDHVFYVVSELCLEHGRLAFFEGLRLGMELAWTVNRGKEVVDK